MVTFYEIIYEALELAFPIAILNHQLFGFVLELLTFLLSLTLLVVTIYVPIIIAIRLALKGVKRWF